MSLKTLFDLGTGLYDIGKMIYDNQQQNSGTLWESNYERKSNNLNRTGLQYMREGKNLEAKEAF